MSCCAHYEKKAIFLCCGFTVKIARDALLLKLVAACQTYPTEQHHPVLFAIETGMRGEFGSGKELN